MTASFSSKIRDASLALGFAAFVSMLSRPPASLDEAIIARLSSLVKCPGATRFSRRPVHKAVAAVEPSP